MVASMFRMAGCFLVTALLGRQSVRHRCAPPMGRVLVSGSIQCNPTCSRLSLTRAVDPPDMPQRKAPGHSEGSQCKGPKTFRGGTEQGRPKWPPSVESHDAPGPLIPTAPSSLGEANPRNKACFWCNHRVGLGAGCLGSNLDHPALWTCFLNFKRKTLVQMWVRHLQEQNSSAARVLGKLGGSPVGQPDHVT